MKRLVCLISTEGKTTKQISDETMKAFEKYQKVSKEVEEKVKTDKKDDN